MVVPNELSPQQVTWPVVESAHVYALPAPTSEYVPMGTVDSPLVLVPQHCNAPAVVTPHECVTPAETVLNVPAGGVDIPFAFDPQHPNCELDDNTAQK